MHQISTSPYGAGPLGIPGTILNIIDLFNRYKIFVHTVIHVHSSSFSVKGSHLSFPLSLQKIAK